MKLLDPETLQKIIDFKQGLDEGGENDELLISSLDYIVAKLTDQVLSVALHMVSDSLLFIDPLKQRL
jgi:hypothetical protein